MRSQRDPERLTGSAGDSGLMPSRMHRWRFIRTPPLNGRFRHGKVGVRKLLICSESGRRISSTFLGRRMRAAGGAHMVWNNIRDALMRLEFELMAY